MLVPFDLAKLICLKMDASAYAVAGIISQQADDTCDRAKGTRHSKGKRDMGIRHSDTFWSSSMAPTERIYTVGDQEMLAIGMSCCN
jgi:hypothetical protein